MSDDKKNEEITEQENREEKQDGREVRRRHLQSVLASIMNEMSQDHPTSGAPPSGFLNIMFYEDGNNTVMLTGDYNPIHLYGTVVEMILGLREQQQAGKFKQQIEEAMGEFEKTLAELDGERTDN